MKIGRIIWLHEDDISFEFHFSKEAIVHITMHIFCIISLSVRGRFFSYRMLIAHHRSLEMHLIWCILFIEIKVPVAIYKENNILKTVMWPLRENQNNEAHQIYLIKCRVSDALSERPTNEQTGENLVLENQNNEAHQIYLIKCRVSDALSERPTNEQTGENLHGLAPLPPPPSWFFLSFSFPLFSARSHKSTTRNWR